MVAGWPGRSGRDNLGPDMRDERSTVDTGREFNASQANLLFWQVGALGFGAPIATFVYFGDGVTEELRLGGFSWDQKRYINEPTPAFMAATRNGAGDYTFDFDAQVPGRKDENGQPQLENLKFTFGYAMPMYDADIPLADPGYTMIAELAVLGPQSVQVITRPMPAGPPDPPEDAGMLVLLW